MDAINNLVSKSKKKYKKAASGPIDRFTAEEHTFIEGYIDSPETPAIELVKSSFPLISGYSAKTKRLLEDPRILSEIERRMEIKRYKISYTEDDIINRLWVEATATEKTNAQARIASLKLLGEHIGMFKKAKDKGSDGETGNVINIVNYNNKDITTENTKMIESAPIKELDTDTFDTPNLDTDTSDIKDFDTDNFDTDTFDTPNLDIKNFDTDTFDTTN